MNPTLVQYVHILRLQWRWLIWGVLLSLAVLAITLAFQPPLYRSSALVLVRTPGDVSQVRDGGDSYAQQHAKTYAALADSSLLSARVIPRLGLDLDPQTLSDRVAATNRPGTALIDISVEAPAAEEAQRTSTEVLAEYGRIVRELESVPGSIVPRAELVVIDPPRKAALALNWGLPLYLILLIAVLIGLFVGATMSVLFESKRASKTSAERDSDELSDSAHSAIRTPRRPGQRGGRRRRR